MMRQQAETNRKDLSILYNHIRDLLMQREQALKTHISEIFQKEEDQCLQKLSQIEEVTSQMNQFDAQLG